MTPGSVLANRIIKVGKEGRFIKSILVLENCHLSLKNPCKVLESCLSEVARTMILYRKGTPFVYLLLTNGTPFAYQG